MDECGWIGDSRADIKNRPTILSIFLGCTAGVSVVDVFWFFDDLAADLNGRLIGM